MGTKSVLNTDDDGKSSNPKRERPPRDPAPDGFDAGFKVRCFVCSVKDKAHEFGQCSKALTAGNKIRRQRCMYLALCLACLKRTCRKTQEESGNSWYCYNKNLWIACSKCTDASEKKDKFDWTNSQFVCTNHSFNPDPSFVKSMAGKLGSSPTAEMAFITGYGMGCLPNGASNHFQMNSNDEKTSEIPEFESIRTRLNQFKNSSEGSTVAPVGETST